MRDVLAGCGVALFLGTACAEGIGIGGSPVDPDPAGSTTASDETSAGTGTTTGIQATSSSGEDESSTSGEGSSESSTDVDDGSSTGSTGAASMCGNGMIEGDEACDGDELGGMTCADVDPEFTGGVLTCSSNCTLETTACVDAPNPYTHCIAVGQAIPDGSATGVTSSWTIPPGQAPGQVVDVNVRVEIDHTYVGDLGVDLIHGGTSVRVFDRRCTTNDDLIATFDDEAGAAIPCLMTEADATVRPENSLTAFDGDATETQWSLFVRDFVGSDVGTLVQWCITVQWSNP